MLPLGMFSGLAPFVFAPYGVLVAAGAAVVSALRWLLCRFADTAQ